MCVFGHLCRGKKQFPFTKHKFFTWHPIRKDEVTRENHSKAFLLLIWIWETRDRRKWIFFSTGKTLRSCGHWLKNYYSLDDFHPFMPNVSTVSWVGLIPQTPSVGSRVCKWCGYIFSPSTPQFMTDHPLVKDKQEKSMAMLFSQHSLWHGSFKNETWKAKNSRVFMSSNPKEWSSMWK